MNLLDIGKKILGMGLPVLGTALGGPAGGMVAGLVSHALGLGGDTDPSKMAAAIDANPQQAKIVLQKLQDDHQEELAWISAQQAQAQQTGQTMRVEYGSTDPYVRRWRPTWGYVTAGAWALEALAIFTVAVIAAVMGLHGQVDQASKLLGALTSLMYALSALWTIALAVLGINIVQRSRDKQTQAGQKPGPLTEVGKLISAIPGLGGNKTAPSSSGQ